MRDLKNIKDEEKELDEEYRNRKEALREARTTAAGNKLIKCAGFGCYKEGERYKNGCQKTSPVRLWGYETRLYWDNNCGDPNGGFYTSGGPATDSLICPKCGKANYIYNHPDKEKILEIISNKPKWAFKTEKKPDRW